MSRDVKGKRVAVFGMAKSGLALVRLLTEKGAIVRAADARPLAELPGAAEVLAECGVPFVEQGPPALEGVDIAVLSPGVPPDQELFDAARRCGVEVTGDVELASAWLKGPVIGVTGSNGKTTVTALVGHLLKECGIAGQVGGNIGTVAVAAMVGSSREDQWNVLELSSFQTEMFERMRVNIGVALNVTPDHLDRHKTMENYAAAKLNMFIAQRAGDSAVLNAENDVTASWSGQVKGETHFFNAGGRVERGFWSDGERLYSGGEEWMRAEEIPLRGRHNLENVLAAGCAAKLAGADLDGLRVAVRTFPGVAHRIEFVATVNGVDYYNDSKATNVDATIKALESFDGRLWLILGGKDKGSDYTPLRALLSRRAKAALLIGAAAKKILNDIDGSAPVVDCGDLSAALEHARSKAVAGDTVLLAPACASFDQFKSYEHRGDVFKEIVRQFAGREA